MVDPYLVSFLARHGAPLVLCPLWAGWAVGLARRGRWAAPGVLVGLIAASAWGLGTCLVPLLSGGLIPEATHGLQLADDAPLVALAALAIAGPTDGTERVPGFDLATLAIGGLIPHGAAGWLLGVLLLSRGWLQPRRARGLLLVGLVGLGVCAGIDAHRLEARALVGALLRVSFDAASLWVSAITTGARIVGLAALTAQLVASRASASASPSS